MRERTTQIVLLVRAIEEADPAGHVLPLGLRTSITRRALMVTGLSETPEELSSISGFRYAEAVSRRARLIWEALRRKAPALSDVLRVARLGAGTAPTVIGTALALGLMTNLLGAQRTINLLSFPLLGLLCWNLLIYLALIALALVRRPRLDGESGRRSLDALPARLAGLFLRGALWRRVRGLKMAHKDSVAWTRVGAKAIVRFGAMWHRQAGPLLAARVRWMLHLGAIALVVGALAGMYLRGIAFEYRATWESTLLGAGQVRLLLGLVLGPAAWLLGVEIPDVSPLQGPGSGHAAIWIHLYAVTAVLFVVLPRAVLASIESWRGSRLAAAMQPDLDDGYYRRLFTEWRGASRLVEILPYSYHPQQADVDQLKTLLHDYFGARADVRLAQGLVYGEEPPEPEPSPGEPTGDDRQTCSVVLFNLAQSPEVEVHGMLLSALKDRLATHDGLLLVALDVSQYRERVDAPERWRQRKSAWDWVVREAGLTALEWDPGRPIDDGLLSEVRAALWPPAEPAATED